MFFEVFDRVISLQLKTGGLIDRFDEGVRKGVRFIRKKYSGKYLKKEANSIDFNDPIYRCAYVYLFCTSHSIIVAKTLSETLDINPGAFSVWHEEADFVKDRMLKVCSLGGGPGSEIVGILFFFLRQWDDSPRFTFNFKLVDAYSGWENTCVSSIHSFCDLSKVDPRRVHLQFSKQNLLDNLKPSTVDAISNAHILTLVKVVSAIGCDIDGTAILIKKIFSLLQTNTWVVYVDNSHNGAHKRMCNFARAAGLEAVYGPFCPIYFAVDREHEKMDNLDYYTKLFGCEPQVETNLSLGIWRKPEIVNRKGLKRASEWIGMTGDEGNACKKAARESETNFVTDCTAPHEFYNGRVYIKDNASSKRFKRIRRATSKRDVENQTSKCLEELERYTSNRLPLDECTNVTAKNASKR